MKRHRPRFKKATASSASRRRGQAQRGALVHEAFPPQPEFQLIAKDERLMATGQTELQVARRVVHDGDVVRIMYLLADETGAFNKVCRCTTTRTTAGSTAVMDEMVAL
jgi:hypothetical protein